MDKDTKIILGVVIIAIVIIAILGVGAVYLFSTLDFEKKDTTPENPIPYDDDDDDDNIYYEDTAFIIWYGDALDDLQDYNDHIIDALDGSNWFSIEFWAEETESFIDELKPECQAFYLSYNYGRLRDEFYDFLVDDSWACFYMKWSASYAQDGYYSKATEDMETATDYTNKATRHMENCNDIFSEIK